jgi:hypothetical protein
MKTILMTNCDNIFGTTLIKNLIGKHNILRLVSHKSVLDRTNKIEYIPYTYSDAENLQISNNVTEINTIVNHANNTYGGINVCVDCKHGKVNDLDMQTLLLHYSVIQSGIDDCKIIYNHNKVQPNHINEVYPSNKASGYNCDGNVQTAIDIIEDTYKFSTNTGTPYFDLDSNEGKYSPLLYF